MAVKTLQSDEAHTQWRDILDEACAGEEVVIERSHKPMAVLVGYEEWKAMKQAHHDAIVARRLQELAANPDIAVPWDEVKAGMTNA